MHQLHDLLLQLKSHIVHRLMRMLTLILYFRHIQHFMRQKHMKRKYNNNLNGSEKKYPPPPIPSLYQFITIPTIYYISVPLVIRTKHFCHTFR